MVLLTSCHVCAPFGLYTGEWCYGVLEYFNASHFKGRGVQYHLGFHQASGLCRGRVTMADSHFLTVMLERRVLGGYYLGCPMTHNMRDALLNLTRDATMVSVQI
jgi:hypothetical protein